MIAHEAIGQLDSSLGLRCTDSHICQLALSWVGCPADLNRVLLLFGGQLAGVWSTVALSKMTRLTVTWPLRLYQANPDLFTWW